MESNSRNDWIRSMPLGQNFRSTFYRTGISFIKLDDPDLVHYICYLIYYEANVSAELSMYFLQTNHEEALKISKNKIFSIVEWFLINSHEIVGCGSWSFLNGSSKNAIVVEFSVKEHRNFWTACSTVTLFLFGWEIECLYLYNVVSSKSDDECSHRLEI